MSFLSDPNKIGVKFRDLIKLEKMKKYLIYEFEITSITNKILR